MKRKTYRYHKYEESFLELEIDHVSNTKACILDTERQIKKLCGKVVLATIADHVILTIQFSDELIYLSQNTMESVLHFIIILIKFQDICLIYRVSMKIPQV
jgi:hypothetical protein